MGGVIFIDRDPKHFGTILNFLRDDNVALPDNRKELEELKAEANHYYLSTLAKKCKQQLKFYKDDQANSLKRDKICQQMCVNQAEISRSFVTIGLMHVLVYAKGVKGCEELCSNLAEEASKLTDSMKNTSK